MARNTTAMKRGWNYDKPNGKLKAMVDGKEAYALTAADLYATYKVGVAYETSASIIDGYGVDLSTGYSASASNRLYGLDINADTGSTDLTGDTMVGAIRGRTVIGTTQTNASIYGVHGNIDVGASKNIISNYAGVYGVVDFYGDTTIAGSVSHVAGGFFTIWNEGTTTLNSAGGSLSGIECIQIGSPTITSGVNAAVYARASAVASNWKHAIYGAADNGIDLTCVNDGVRVTSSTLNATAGRSGYFSGSIAAANLGDGYGAVEVDITLTGTSAGHTAALSSWLNLPSGTVTAGNFLCAQSNGIYEASGVTMGAGDLIFGMRASAILGDTTGWGALCPFSLNTSNQSITAIFQIASGPAIGLVNGSPSTSTVASGTIPIVCNAGGGSVRYVHVYSTTS